MTVPRYTRDNGRHDIFEAEWSDGTRMPIRVSRERSYPGDVPWSCIHAELYRMAGRHVNTWAATNHVGIPTVLDAGCGSGYGTEILADAVSIAVGVDVDTATIEFARRCYGNRFFASPLTDLPFDTSTFHAVACIEVLEHIEDDTGAMAEISLVTKDGGLLFLTTPEASASRPPSEYHVREYSEPHLRSVLEGAGFTDITRHRVSNFGESLIVTAVAK